MDFSASASKLHSVLKRTVDRYLSPKLGSTADTRHAIICITHPYRNASLAPFVGQAIRTTALASSTAFAWVVAPFVHNQHSCRPADIMHSFSCTSGHVLS
jgi:hypothetical protein